MSVIYRSSCTLFLVSSVVFGYRVLFPGGGCSVGAVGTRFDLGMAHASLASEAARRSIDA